MKKVIAIVLSLALAFPAASLLAQQAPAPAKQPMQVAQGGPPPAGLFGLGMAATVGLIVVAVVVVANVADDDDDALPVTAPATATTGTR